MHRYGISRVRGVVAYIFRFLYNFELLLSLFTYRKTEKTYPVSDENM